MDAVSGETDDALSALMPSLFQMFVVIITGFVCARLNVIRQAHQEGLSLFVTKLALPSLLFLGMANLDFHQVKWNFLFAVTVGKFVVFLVAMGITVLLSIGSSNFLGMAAIHAMFVSQSNDFALGLPIFLSIFGATHPEYISYFYLVAPISLILLNPLAFFLLEVDRRSLDKGTSIDDGYVALPDIPCRSNGNGNCHFCWRVLCGVFSSPVVFMVPVGVVANILFNHSFPDLLSGPFVALGSSFSPLSLFIMGMSMAHQIGATACPGDAACSGSAGVPIILALALTACKCILLPLVIVVVLVYFSVPTSLLVAGLLYGALPATPATFFFAAEYDLCGPWICLSTVLCTVLFAPLLCLLLLLSSLLLSPSPSSPSQWFSLYSEPQIMPILGAVAALWTLATLWWTYSVRNQDREFEVSHVDDTFPALEEALVKDSDVDEIQLLADLSMIPNASLCWSAVDRTFVISISLCWLVCCIAHLTCTSAVSPCGSSQSSPPTGDSSLPGWLSLFLALARHLALSLGSVGAPVLSCLAAVSNLGCLWLCPVRVYKQRWRLVAVGLLAAVAAAALPALLPRGRDDSSLPFGLSIAGDAGCMLQCWLPFQSQVSLYPQGAGLELSVVGLINAFCLCTVLVVLGLSVGATCKVREALNRSKGKRHAGMLLFCAFSCVTMMITVTICATALWNRAGMPSQLSLLLLLLSVFAFGQSPVLFLMYAVRAGVVTPLCSVRDWFWSQLNACCSQGGCFKKNPKWMHRFGDELFHCFPGHSQARQEPLVVVDVECNQEGGAAAADDSCMACTLLTVSRSQS